MATPFTPRAPSRTAHLGLSNKQLDKITGTIANVRRKREQKTTGEALDEEVEDDTHPRRRSAENGREHDRRKGRHVSGQTKPSSKGQEDTSFAAEASFVRAPLNTRIVNRPSAAPAHPQPTHNGKGKEKEHDPTSLRGMPLEVQEALVLEDLLFVLMGIPGTYITIHPSYDPEDSPDGVQFAPNPTLDPSLRDLVERILPLATHYTAITAFLQQRSQLECGLVNHALCAAIREMLNNDYLTLISQLEHLFNTSPAFTLQKLWFYVHPTLHTLSLIYNLTEELMKGDFPDSLENEDDDDDEEVDEIDAIDEELGLGFGKKSKLKVLLEDAGIIKGGEVVALLWDRVINMSGDPTAHELYLTLFRKASTPYADILRRWISTGHLKDPYDEFLVKESRDINRGIIDVDFIDEYWERRYTLRDGSGVGSRQAGVPKPRTEGGRLPGGACVPPLLDAWKQKILLAGKYLNVIRECGIEVTQIQSDSTKKVKEKPPAEDEEPPKVEAESVPLDDERFYQAIEDSYTFANRTLLRLLVKDQDLVPRLRSLKYYFFLSHSAYLGGFFENARSELAKQAKYASISKLQSLYELALASSPDPEEGGVFRSDIKLTMVNNTVWDFLTNILNIEGALNGDDLLNLGKPPKERVKDKDASAIQAMDAMTLDYHVKFPLSLIISRKAILHYQLLFRFLLHLKHAEQSLTDMWMEHKAPPWSSRSTNPELERWKLRVIILRSKMLAYIQNVLAFVTGDILEGSWNGLSRQLERAAKEGSGGTVDQLLRDHTDFLNNCMKGCLLTTARFLKLYASIITTCSRYAVYGTRMTRSLEAAMEALAKGDADLKSTPMSKRWDPVIKFETNFSHTYRAFYDLVQYNAMSENNLMPLVHRLNQARP